MKKTNDDKKKKTIQITGLIEDGIIRIVQLVGSNLRDHSILLLTQFLKFGIVGISNTIISISLYYCMLKFLTTYSFKWDYLLANMFAFVLSVLWSFYWNNRFVFIDDAEEKRNTIHTLIKTYIAYGFSGVVLANLLSVFWIEIMQVSKFVAPCLNLLITVPVNFFINRNWAFKKNR